jgi:GNAT superfamily N-acetyltransferase
MTGTHADALTRREGSAAGVHLAHRTARLLVANARAGDVPDIALALAHPEVGPAYTIADMPLEDVIAAGTFEGPAKTMLTCVARDVADGAFVGVVRVRDGRLSYFVARAHWGHGYAKELVTFASEVLCPGLGLRFIEASILRENARSRRVVEACGFTFDELYENIVRDASGAARSLPTLRYVLKVQARQ